MGRKIAPTLRRFLPWFDQYGTLFTTEEHEAVAAEVRALLSVAREAQRWAMAGQSNQEFVTACAFLRRALARLDKASGGKGGTR